MKSLIKILFIAALTTGAGHTFAKSNSVAYNNVQDRHLSGFRSIDVSGSFDVYIIQGTTESVRVEAPEDVSKHIITEVKGGTLKVYDKEHFSFNWGHLFSGHKKIAIYITAKDVNSIELAGSGNVSFKEGINANTLQLKLSGSGNLSGKVNVKSLESSLSGSGNFKVYGHAESSSVSVVGSGNFTARDLNTVNTAVHVVGSGNAYISASNKIDANVSGSGDIRYSGSAKNISKSKSGSGDISRD